MAPYLLLVALALSGCGRLGFDATSTNDGTTSPLACVTSMAVTERRTCAVRGDGELYCWGRNVRGELGDGTRASSPTPVTVIPSGALTVTTGRNHTCAPMTSGVLRCWGANDAGQLGDGTTTPRSTPQPATVLTPSVISAAAGDFFTCAMTNAGAVYCWGEGSSGQLGDGNATSSMTPVLVTAPGLPAATSVVAGTRHACLRGVDDSVWCWGSNSAGQLGDGTNTARAKPVVVPGLINIADLSAAGGTTCAMLTSGSVRCWGDDDNGQLGDGPPNTASNTPVVVSGISTAIDLGIGPLHNCAVLANNTVMCWGRGNDRLGTGDPTSSSVPVAVPGLANVQLVDVGDDSGCAVHTNGTMSCWGQNDAGELGDGTYVNAPTPHTVLATGVGGFAMAGYHVCVTVGTRVDCWGSNSNGELGNGGAMSPTRPAHVTSGVRSVAISESSSCAVGFAGDVSCWGDNLLGMLGDGTTTSSLVPRLVPGVQGAKEVVSGLTYACARGIDGSVSCWGSNNAGELGDGTTAQHPSPAPALISGAASEIAGGTQHVCARLSDDSIECWGQNDFGQIGDGTTSARRQMPARVAMPIAMPVQLRAGSDHTCARTADRRLFCWGSNATGQLGTGNTVPSMLPVEATAFGRVDDVSTSFNSMCTVSLGQVSCVGANDAAQLGDGTFTDKTQPGPVVGLTDPVSFVVVGSDHSCAVAGDGVWCWGSGAYGQIGDGGLRSRPMPTRVDVPCP